MADTNSLKVPMTEQEPTVRNKNFGEVALGYTPQQAMEEAKRCLKCKNRPCMNGCPVNVKIPEFLAYIADGEFEKAYQKITETNTLPAVCGRVCPQENQCEGKCVRGIKGESVSIGRLERFAADYHRQHCSHSVSKIETNGKKVAVIGSGPASLSCAGDLAKLGYGVTVFEAFHTAGGVLMYGIPEFRLPKDIVREEIDGLKALGVEIQTNMVIGKILSVDEILNSGYEAVFIGTGAGLPKFMGINGEELNGVYSANEFLTRINLMKAYKFPDTDTPIKVGKNVAVIGGGNVAMDAARCAKRLGAENVYIVYRRGKDEMPARNEEINHAEEEGIIFKNLNTPTEIIGENGWVKGLKCVSMTLGEPDSSGRRKPIPLDGTEHVIEADTVIVAIGQSPNPLIKSTTDGLKTQPWGGIVADEETCATSKDGVFAGGDAVTGAATVILAMGAGKKAAVAIDKYIRKKPENQ